MIQHVDFDRVMEGAIVDVTYTGMVPFDPSLTHRQIYEEGSIDSKGHSKRVTPHPYNSFLCNLMV